MELYLNILKAFLDKGTYERYISSIDKEFLRKNYPELVKVINSFDKLHNLVKEPKVVDLEGIFYSEYPNADREVFQRLFERVRQSESASQESVIEYLRSTQQRAHATKLAFDLLDYAEDKPNAKCYEEIMASVSADGSRQSLSLNDYTYVDDDIESLYSKQFAAGGLHWRLQCLNRALGPLRVGDFGFIFARPETGKTSFLASEVTHFASQLGEEKGPILWFNNEEVHDKVLLRCYTASIGVPLERVLANRTKAKELFYENTRRKIIVPDLDSTSRKDVERLCDIHKPSLVVVDQLDKVEGFVGDREDLHLGAIYQWARELAKRYSPVIGVSQADGSGEGIKWLGMGNVANAKTAKQAEADWIAGIGLSFTDSPNVRGIAICKNKLLGGEESVPDLRHGRLEVILDPMTGRYHDTAQ